VVKELWGEKIFIRKDGLMKGESSAFWGEEGRIWPRRRRVHDSEEERGAISEAKRGGGLVLASDHDFQSGGRDKPGGGTGGATLTKKKKTKALSCGIWEVRDCDISQKKKKKRGRKRDRHEGKKGTKRFPQEGGGRVNYPFIRRKKQKKKKKGCRIKGSPNWEKKERRTGTTVDGKLIRNRKGEGRGSSKKEMGFERLEGKVLARKKRGAGPRKEQKEGKHLL